MRGTWVNEGYLPDYPKLTQHGITDLAFSVRPDQGHSQATIDAARSRGYKVWLYSVNTWYTNWGDPMAYADRLSADVTRLGGNDRQLSVMADIEWPHDSVYIATFLNRWRAHRQLRETAWTMEGYQGGGKDGSWMATAKPTILGSKVLLVPQTYEGNMTPQNPGGVLNDLTEAGFPCSLISFFYNSRAVPFRWAGWAFQMNELP